MGIRGGYNFLNMARYRTYSEQSYRNNFEQRFDFIGFNNHCQGRSENKLHFHFNASLTTVSLAKAAYYLPLEKHQKESFSMSDVKTLNANKIIADRIFSNLDLDLSQRKIKVIYRQALFFGSISSMAA